MDTNVQTRDFLRRVGLMMDKAIGRVIINGGVQVGKPFDVRHVHPIVNTNLLCLVDGWYGGMRRNRVIGR